MKILERYSRQDALFDQEKVKELSVKVEGTQGIFAEYCLAGIGVGEVQGSGMAQQINPYIEETKQAEKTMCIDALDPLEAAVEAAMKTTEILFGKEPCVKTKVITRPTNKKIAIIGAGGIGTYAALFAKECGAHIDVFDDDIIEASNLNRQVFYSGRIGEKKSLVLAEILELHEGIPRKITHRDKSLLQQYDVVLSCVDSAETRKLLDTICFGKVPLIDGGTSAWGGRVHHNYKPLAEQLTLVSKKKESCAEAESSVIMPNMIIGAAMASQINNPKGCVRYDVRTNTLFEVHYD